MTVLNDFMTVNCRLYSVNTGVAQTPHPPALSGPARVPRREGALGATRKELPLRVCSQEVLRFNPPDNETEVWEEKPPVSGCTDAPWQSQGGI